MKLVRQPLGALFVACALFFILWLLGSHYPVVGDSILYSLLGKNIIEHGTYSVFLGEVYDNYMPAYSIATYPFAKVFGLAWGIKYLALLSGWAALSLSFVFVKRHFSPAAAALAPLLLVATHIFSYNPITGAIDMFFITFILSAILSYENALNWPRWYFAMAGALAVACLSRYNAMPFVVFLFVHMLYTRPQHRRLGVAWLAWVLTAVPPALWLLRSAFILADTGSNSYLAFFLGSKHQSVFAQIIDNTIYYLNPIHNYLPILYLFILYGIWRYGRERLSLFYYCAGLMITYIAWPTAYARYGLPMFPFLIGFGAQAVVDAWRTQFAGHKIVKALVITSVVLLHGTVMCAYNFGWCNARLDQAFAFIPKDLNLTSEKLESFRHVIQYVNENAAAGDYVYLTDRSQVEAYANTVLRPDLQPTNDPTACPGFGILRGGTPPEPIVFTSPSHPQFIVTSLSCSP